MIVAVLGLEGVLGFELMIPGQVFGMANLAAADDAIAGSPSGPTAASRYEVRVCTQRPKISTRSPWGSVEIRTPFGIEAIADADVVIVPGSQDFLSKPDLAVIDHLCAAFERGARLASVCVGAFTLAAAGLLDGRRATTHWQWAQELALLYPRIQVDPTVLFVDDGQILTSAGVASGLDLCLHLIRQDAGADLAARTSRRLVIPAWRDGGQAQYIEHTDPTGPTHPLQSTIAWMEENAHVALDLDTIARHAAMSARSLNRQFRDHIGTTPIQLLIQLRVDRARRLLESTQLTMDHVAKEAGFGSHASLRYHFSRIVGIAPHKYRANYVVRGN